MQGADAVGGGIYLVIALAPLFGALVAGLLGKQVGRVGSHLVTTASVAISFLLSAYVLYGLSIGDRDVFNGAVYEWARFGDLRMEIGFLIDRLSAVMMVVVTFVSLMVHIYTIGYMRDDPGYSRFFSFISLFTFAMLMLVMANNFLQLFFGWEAVGLVSYLLIGFWYKRPSAIRANLKAFLLNRVGDFGFLLGIAAILAVFGSFDYVTVFGGVEGQLDRDVDPWLGLSWPLLDTVCILLFIGAMGKSAQIPLHAWLPDSMEGPTPISALIHAATMVTAGIFMVARMSPIFEFAPTALAFVLFVGATTAFFMGLIGLVQADIKRVVAYSTLSQLGYMTAALGASAYDAAIFHLVTHAFFKALLFLAAGSVIIALHHEQDMRKMGGLGRRMPITWITAWIGGLALIGFPGFSGFYSKEGVLDAVHHASGWVGSYAYWLLFLGVFVTALYTFRMIYLVFHGKPRMPEESYRQVKESSAVVSLPLIALAIPSLLLGAWLIEPFLFDGYFGAAIFQLHDPLASMAEHFHDPVSFALHGFELPVIWLALAGFVLATVVFGFLPQLAGSLEKPFAPLAWVLRNKYGFDVFYERFVARSGAAFGRGLWRYADDGIIDGWLVNGSAKLIAAFSRGLRLSQTGYLYHYAFAMIVGLIALIGVFVLRAQS